MVCKNVVPAPIFSVHRSRTPEAILFTQLRGNSAVKARPAGSGTRFRLAQAGWNPAAAKIDGADILVSSPPVAEPLAVRYGWADNPICNLFNQAGLPASPFRTDDFPFSNQEAK